MGEKARVVGVEHLGPAAPGESGVLSCRFVLIAELEHEDLEMLFEQSPDWVIEKRLDWVKIFHPEALN